MSFLHTSPPILSYRVFRQGPAHCWCQPQTRACRSLTRALTIQSCCESFVTQSVGPPSQPGDTDRLGDCKNGFPRKPENSGNAVLLDENSSFSDLTTSFRFNLVSMTNFFHFNSLSRKKKTPHFTFIYVFKTTSQIVHRTWAKIQQSLLTGLEIDLWCLELLDQCLNLSTDD